DAGEEVEVTAPGLVVEVLHVTLHDHERLAVVQEGRGVTILPPHREHFLARGTGIGARRMIVRRDGWPGGSHGGHHVLQSAAVARSGCQMIYGSLPAERRLVNPASRLLRGSGADAIAGAAPQRRKGGTFGPTRGRRMRGP